MAGKSTVRKNRGMRLVNRWRRSVIRDVVNAVRSENDIPMSPNMRLVADEIAVEILAEQHGIFTTVKRARLIASAS